MRGGDSFRTVSSGERLRVPAQAWNALMKMVREHNQRTASTAIGSSPTLSGSDDSGGAIVQVRNTTEDAIPAFGIAALADPTFAISDSLHTHAAVRQAFDVVAPVLPDHLGRFCITLGDVPPASMGYAIAVGVALCKVDVAGGGGGGDTVVFADIDDGSTAHLRPSANGSAQVLWVEEGEGEKWAVVRLGNRVRERLRVEITGWDEGDGSAHHWQEADPADASAPRKGGGEDDPEPAAREINGREYVEVGAVVDLWIEGDASSSGGTSGGGGYWFDVGHGPTAGEASDPAADEDVSASTATWDRDDQHLMSGGFDPGSEAWGVAQRVFTRFFPGEIASDTLPALLSRDLVFDSNGGLSGIAGEVLKEIGVVLADVATEMVWSEGSATLSYVKRKAIVLAADAGTPETIDIAAVVDSESGGSGGGGGSGGDPPLDELVKIDAADLSGGYLNDKLLVTNPWISKTVTGADGTNKTITLAHTDAQSETFTKAVVTLLTTVDVGGTKKLRITATPISADGKGHVRDASPTAVTVDLDLVGVTVQTDDRYDTSSHKLQKKTRTLYVPLADTESGWTDVHAAVQETWLTNFQVDGTTMKLQKKTNSAYVLEKGTESGWTDIHTGQSCSG